MQLFNFLESYPQLDISLPNDKIHLWYTYLYPQNFDLDKFFQILSDDEKLRVKTFHFKKDKECFLIGRGILRLLLSAYLGIKPYDVEFYYGTNGKPFLNMTSNVNFNLSHSQKLLVLSFSRNRMIGVDIEYIQLIDIKNIVERFFSPIEYKMFEGINESDRLISFFKWWTRKESFIKAIGKGMTQCFREFDVTVLPDHEAKILNIRNEANEAASWSLHDIIIDPDYSCCVCIENVKDEIIKY